MTERNEAVERILLVVIPLSLIFDIGKQLFFPETNGEWPSPTVTFMTVAAELGMVIGVAGLTLRRLKSQQGSGNAAGAWMVLPVIGLLAGLGLLATRLVGGPRGELPPRSTQSSAEELPPELERVAVRLTEFLESFEKGEAEVVKTRVMQTMQKAPRELGKLSREDLRDYGIKQRAMLDAIDRGIQFLSEPGASDKIDRLYRQPAVRKITRDVKRGEFELRRWQLVRKIWGGTDRVVTIIGENWDEWRSIESFPAEAEQKPWQKEIRQLQGELASAKKELEELIGASEATTTAPKPTPDPKKVEFARLQKELKAVHATFKSRWDKLLETRWARTEGDDPIEGRNSSFAAVIAGAIPKLRKLSREDLSEFRQAQRALLDSYDQALKLFEESRTKGYDAFNPGDNAGGWYRNLPIWQAAHHAHSIAYAQSELVEQNWEEWKRQGPKSKGKQKPWQQKAQQLQLEFDAAFKAWEALR